MATNGTFLDSAEHQLEASILQLRGCVQAEIQEYAATSASDREHTKGLLANIQTHMADMRARMRDMELLAEEQDTVEQAESLAVRLALHKQAYVKLQQGYRAASLQVHQNAEKKALEDRRALLGSGEAQQRQVKLETEADVVGAAANVTGSLQRTYNMLAEEIEHTNATLAAMGTSHETLKDVKQELTGQRVRLKRANQLLATMKRHSWLDFISLWGSVALFALVVTYIVTKRAAYFVPAGLMPTRATFGRVFGRTPVAGTGSPDADAYVAYTPPGLSPDVPAYEGNFPERPAGATPTPSPVAEPNLDRPGPEGIREARKQPYQDHVEPMGGHMGQGAVQWDAGAHPGYDQYGMAGGMAGSMGGAGAGDVRGAPLVERPSPSPGPLDTPTPSLGGATGASDAPQSRPAVPIQGSTVTSTPDSTLTATPASADQLSGSGGPGSVHAESGAHGEEGDGDIPRGYTTTAGAPVAATHGAHVTETAPSGLESVRLQDGGPESGPGGAGGEGEEGAEGETGPGTPQPRGEGGRISPLGEETWFDAESGEEEGGEGIGEGEGAGPSRASDREPADLSGGGERVGEGEGADSSGSDDGRATPETLAGRADQVGGAGGGMKEDLTYLPDVGGANGKETDAGGEVAGGTGSTDFASDGELAGGTEGNMGGSTEEGQTGLVYEDTPAAVNQEGEQEEEKQDYIGRPEQEEGEAQSEGLSPPDGGTSTERQVPRLTIVKSRDVPPSPEEEDELSGFEEATSAMPADDDDDVEDDRKMKEEGVESSVPEEATSAMGDESSVPEEATSAVGDKSSVPEEATSAMPVGDSDVDAGDLTKQKEQGGHIWPAKTGLWEAMGDDGDVIQPQEAAEEAAGGEVIKGSGHELDGDRSGEGGGDAEAATQSPETREGESEEGRVSGAQGSLSELGVDVELPEGPLDPLRDVLVLGEETDTESALGVGERIGLDGDEKPLGAGNEEPLGFENLEEKPLGAGKEKEAVGFENLTFRGGVATEAPSVLSKLATDALPDVEGVKSGGAAGEGREGEGESGEEDEEMESDDVAREVATHEYDDYDSAEYKSRNADTELGSFRDDNYLKDEL